MELNQSTKVYYIFTDSTYNIIMNYLIITNGTDINNTLFPISIKLKTISTIDNKACNKFVYTSYEMSNIFKKSKIKNIENKLLNNFDNFLYIKDLLDFYYRPKFIYKIDSEILYVGQQYNLQIQYEDLSDVQFINFYKTFKIKDDSQLLNKPIIFISKSDFINNNMTINLNISSEYTGTHYIKLLPTNIQLIKPLIIPLNFYQKLGELN